MTARYTWERLGIYEMLPRSEEETLKSLAATLKSNAEMHAQDRKLAARYLSLLAGIPEALAAIRLRGRGRPRSADTQDIALDYLVCKELHGARRAKVARSEVAKAWSVSEKMVLGASAGHKGAGAAWRLNQLIGATEGRKRVGRRQSDGSTLWEYWSRRELLEAVRDDLRDRRKARRGGPRN